MFSDFDLPPKNTSNFTVSCFYGNILRSVEVKMEQRVIGRYIHEEWGRRRRRDSVQ